MWSRTYLLVAASLSLAGCQSAMPSHYSELESSSLLQPDASAKSGRVPFSYSGNVNWSSYNSAILDPVIIYQGADNQFGNMTEAEKKTLADYLYSRVREQLATRFALTTKPSPSTLRVRVTLTGAVKNTPVLGTFSRIDVAGIVYNTVQTARDGEGSFTGSVMYAVEVFNSQSNQLLTAFVGKQFPKPSDIGASLGDLTAAKAGIDRGATELVGRLR